MRRSRNLQKMIFNPLEHPVCLELPRRLELTAWAGHIPLAMFLISALRPRVFVELGTHRGESYCAFCQAVAAVTSETECYAVDTWQGDAHAGAFEAEILLDLKAHHDPLYAGFSRLIQSTFDAALPQFADGSIDLLHIDGFHTYEAVRHDFETWLPKMSEQGIVLFHDTTVREQDFGVWKFWAEAAATRPGFEFTHAHGLGVLAVGATVPEPLRFLFAADANQAAVIRSFFEAVGARIELTLDSRQQSERVAYLEKYEEIVESSRAIRKFQRFKTSDAGRFLRKLIGKSVAND